MEPYQSIEVTIAKTGGLSGPITNGHIDHILALRQPRKTMFSGSVNVEAGRV